MKNKKQTHKLRNIFFSIILIGLILFVGLVVLAGGWDNFKLQSTQYWGLFTLSNNPLLESQDSDLKNIKDSSQEPRIEPSQLRSGGPPKDGIPSIDNPQFVSAEESKFNNDEKIIGVYHNGVAKAYPYGIMNWHEIVNDEFNGTPVIVSYCPLCDTNLVFSPIINGERREFGVSGKLFQSCLVMFDRKSDSLWSQVWGIGVGGEHTNEELEQIPAQRTTLGEWKEKHPQTQVLSTNTGYSRNYFEYPYGSYFTDSRLIFGARNQHLREEGLHPKEIVSYIYSHNNQTPTNEFSGESHQFVHKEIKELGEKQVEFRGDTVTAKWDEELETVKVIDSSGNIVPSVSAFSFVYAAYFK